MPLERKLAIASRVLCPLIAQDRTRDTQDRIEDIIHALEIADELINRCMQPKPPADDHTLKPAVGVREAVVERDQVQLSDMISERRGVVSKPTRGPTYH
jgi:hypothetical protein